VSDNGVAETNSFHESQGVGLIGIHERVTALGGELNLMTQSQGGLLIAIRLPVSETPQQESM
jgi:glucose-6-phosphate-specific signal transduction histidine kinase